MWVLVPMKCHSPPISKSSLFLKSFYPPSLLANWSSHFFLINRNHTVKLSSINTIYEKQQHNFNFFIFKFTLKYMLGNVYINTIHARQCLYNKFILQGSFSILSNFSLYPKESFTSHFKPARKKRFFNGATSH